MTSLQETLPILDEAVPALPEKLKTVATAAEEFERVARTTVAALHEKRELAEALVEQVRDVLTALDEQLASEQQAVEAASQSLQQAAEEEAQAIDQAVDEMETEGNEAEASFSALQGELVQAGERTRAAHEEAKTALDELGQQARTSPTELEGAVDEMTAAVEAVEKSVTDGQTLLAQGAAALTALMTRLVAEAQARLGQTAQRLEDLRQEQETTVVDALSKLETQRQQLEQELDQRLDTEIEKAVDAELEAVVDALGEMGSQVAQLQSDTENGREGLTTQLTEVGERVPPLQAAVTSVQETAQQINVPWP